MKRIEYQFKGTIASYATATTKKALNIAPNAIDAFKTIIIIAIFLVNALGKGIFAFIGDFLC